uniref:BZIP domain class transcription factor n=1 Tax=Rhizophora mucronata TaxID=61149 RepID=A0A2P2JSN5_RHIMU
MASPSGASSGSNLLRSSSSEEDQRKRKRMLSNRESARRSRMRKQKHLDELKEQLDQLKKQNDEILASLNVTNQLYMNMESENSVLRAQVDELTNRLDSLNDIISNVNLSSGPFETEDNIDEHDYFVNPWGPFHASNQPIMDTVMY